jgi:hypothetical protein
MEVVAPRRLLELPEAGGQGPRAASAYPLQLLPTAAWSPQRRRRRQDDGGGASPRRQRQRGEGRPRRATRHQHGHPPELLSLHAPQADDGAQLLIGQPPPLYGRGGQGMGRPWGGPGPAPRTELWSVIPGASVEVGLMVE